MRAASCRDGASLRQSSNTRGPWPASMEEGLVTARILLVRLSLRRVVIDKEHARCPHTYLCCCRLPSPKESLSQGTPCSCGLRVASFLRLWSGSKETRAWVEKVAFVFRRPDQTLSVRYIGELSNCFYMWNSYMYCSRHPDSNINSPQLCGLGPLWLGAARRRYRNKFCPVCCI